MKLKPIFHEDAYFDKTPLEKQRVCCSCKHRTEPDRCDIDGHFISYLACFTAWCRRWKKEEEAAEDVWMLGVWRALWGR